MEPYAVVTWSLLKNALNIRKNCQTIRPNSLKKAVGKNRYEVNQEAGKQRETERFCGCGVSAVGEVTGEGRMQGLKSIWSGIYSSIH